MSGLDDVFEATFLSIKKKSRRKKPRFTAAACSTRLWQSARDDEFEVQDAMIEREIEERRRQRLLLESKSQDSDICPCNAIEICPCNTNKDT
jgi:hypothetical protein